MRNDKTEKTENIIDEIADTQDAEVRVIDAAAVEARLRHLSPANLIQGYYDCINGTLEKIVEAAMRIKLLIQYGVDVSHLPMIGTFLRIATGQICPETVAAFAGSTNFRMIERLPTDVQLRLAKDPMVEAAIPKKGGGFDKRKVDVGKCDPAIFRQVVSPNRTIPLEDQMAKMAERDIKKAVQERKKEFSEAQEAVVRPTVTISGKVTEEELKAFKRHAIDLDLTVAELVRRALLKSGYLKYN